MKKHNKLILVLIGFAIILLAIKFSLPHLTNFLTRMNMNEVQSTVIKQHEESFNVSESQSVAFKQNKSSWNVQTIENAEKLSLGNIFFLDGNIGFANGYEKYLTTFYKTLNGGQDWEKISSIKDFSIYGITFVSQTEGFLVAFKLKPSSSPSENGSYIMKTEDGGQNWQTVYSAVDISFNKIAFNSDGIGLAVGRKSTPTKYDASNFVLLTNDKGQTWIDISDNLNSTAVKPNGRVEDSMTNIIFSKDKDIVVLSLRGKIYNSSDNGKSWTLISELVDEPPQTGISNFGELDDGRFWMSGGAISIEGKWTMISIMKNKFGWDRYRLSGYYFSDVKFLSNDEAIACGVIVAENNFGGANELNKGVILYSSDSGKNWLIIYESEIVKGFSSINKLSENKMFIGGENGTNILLEKFAD